MLFDTIWTELLGPYLSGQPGALKSDAAEGIALMHQRVRELIESGPDSMPCAVALLCHSIKRAKKYTIYKRSRLDVFERHLAGELEADEHPSNGKGKGQPRKTNVGAALRRKQS